MFDTRVEKPAKSEQYKPWQGLVAQVDRILMPAPPGCQNPDHTPESCNCGCQNPKHSSGSCNCGRSDSYKLPIIYNSRYETISDESQTIPAFTFPDAMSLPSSYEAPVGKVKREIANEKKATKSKRRDRKFKLPKLKPIKKISKPKDLLPLESAAPLTRKLSSKKTKQLRSKRKNESPCGYTYESCDPKKHGHEGCPLCYRCKCEPIDKARDNERFSPYDIKVPYKISRGNDAPRRAPTNQEFDDESPSYTGLRDADMYSKYIRQVVAKYPEHMSRRMPDMKEQIPDLMRFIGELSQADKSPGDQMPNEDIRYKLVDNAMDMYKYYEKALSALPKPNLGGNSNKPFKKRGTVLEVIELDPEDYNSGSFKIADDDFSANLSETSASQ